MSELRRPCALSDLVAVTPLYRGHWGPPLEFDPVPWDDIGPRLGFHSAFTIRSDNDWDLHPWDHEVQGDALRDLVALPGGLELRAGHEWAVISANTAACTGSCSPRPERAAEQAEAGPTTGAPRAASIEDLRRMAKRTVPKPVFDYVDGAAWDEVTYRRNRSAFEALALRPRALVDVSSIEMGTTVLGRRIELPIIAPPTGLTGLMHPDGEAAIARAAHAVGTIYTQSALSSLSIEEVHAAAPGPKWFQLYPVTKRPPAWSRELLAQRRARRGHVARVLTVDVAVAASGRERENWSATASGCRRG